jgi:hydrophobe/amphiphile efflux-1 (HAE1) family protein
MPPRLAGIERALTMSIARFFIDRPVFAWVIAISVMLGGIFAITQMSLEQYPDIAPPAITVSATYPGASAKTVEDAVVQVLEQQMTGLDNLLYMSSSSSSSGSASVTLTFKAGTNADTAQVQVQNKVQAANSRLPSTVQEQGVTITKSTSSISMVVALVSEDGSQSSADIGDYVASNVKDPLSRLTGIGSIVQLSSQYAMRIWLDPAKLQKYGLMPADVSNAIGNQNSDLATGELGSLPAAQGQQLDATITARSRLQTPEQFRNIVLKSSGGGAQVLLSDVARVELGSDDYSTYSQYNGKPAGGIGIELASGANAISVANEVKALLTNLAPNFPKGVTAVYPYETTPFVKLSMIDVVETLIEAIILVVLIMYLFLQNLRATLIPTIAVPVVLLGTLGILSLMGYSINTLTMFGLVLAIGLLVDDAIVVVENVERVMREEHLSPLEATRKSMDEVSSALVGIATVLSAVLLPMAFFGGSTGAIYRQFSVTIVGAMVLSVLVALTLTPALCATLLKPMEEHREPRRGIFGWFNRIFDQSTGRYQSTVGRLLGHPRLGMLVYAAIGVLMVVMYMRLPTSFLPTEDQGVLMAVVQLPPGATQQRTQKVVGQAADYFMKQPEIEGTLSILGFSTAGSAQNSAMLFIKLKDWSLRQRSASDIANQSFGALKGGVRDGSIFLILPPAIQSLGSSSGFDLELKDLGGIGHQALISALDKLLASAAKDKSVSQVRFNGLQDTPQFSLDIDDQKAGAMKVSVGDINTTLSDSLGGSYVNDFIDRGRVKKVYIQGDTEFRRSPEDIGTWFVRNSDGDMVPVSSFASSHWIYGPPQLGRYNGMSSVEITGDAGAGVSSGKAMQAMQDLIAQLPRGLGYEWTGMSYQERQSGNQSLYVYGAAVVFAFLCLAALYESWSVPFSVMLVVPLGVLGVALATSLRGLDNDVYFQVGLLTTIGLSAKNAILIVEFATQLEEQGRGLLDATLHAVKMRLRPIVMTSLAFLLGVTPLVISSGAGAAARHAIGTGVFGGTLLATSLGIFFIPLFYVVVRRMSGIPLQGTQAAAVVESP